MRQEILYNSDGLVQRRVYELLALDDLTTTVLDVYGTWIHVGHWTP